MRMFDDLRGKAVLIQGDVADPAAAEAMGRLGTAVRAAALEMFENSPGTKQVTFGADKGYDTSGFVDGLRKVNATPHVAHKVKGTAIDKRTTRHEGYQISQKIRKRVEELFGWIKTTGCLRKTRHRGLERVDWMFTFSVAAYNLTRMRNLIWAQ